MVDSAIVLCAGSGSRMGADPIPKHVLDVQGRRLVEHIVRSLRAAGYQNIVIVHSIERERFFRDLGPDVTLVAQGHGNGTAAAVVSALDDITDGAIVVPGDMPLTSAGFFRRIGKEFTRLAVDVLLVATVRTPAPRIHILSVDGAGRLLSYRLAKPADEHREFLINTGISVFGGSVLDVYAKTFVPEEAEQPSIDIARFALDRGLDVRVLVVADDDNLTDVNDGHMLKVAAERLRSREDPQATG